MTTEYDVSTFTEQQKQDWAEYGIVPGPIHNNFDLCDKSCYVATFEYSWRNPDTKQTVVDLVDLYVITYRNGCQSVLHRTNSKWEGSYGSMPLESFLLSTKFSFHAQALRILFAKGKLTYASRPCT